MDAALSQWISVHSDSPIWVFIGIVLLSYLLEDVAIVTAAGLASQHITSLPVVANSGVCGNCDGRCSTVLPRALLPIFSSGALSVIDQSLLSTRSSSFITKTVY